MIAILADAFVKATAVLLLAAGASVLLRRSTAALRHLVWSLACGGVLALPLASALLPNWRVAGWPRLNVPVAFHAQQVTGEAVLGTPEAAASPRPERDARAPAPQPPAEPTVTFETGSVRWHVTPDWTTLVVPIWLGGVAVVLLLLAVGLARIFWLDRVTAPVRDEAWLILVTELSLELGLTRRVRLLQATGPAMPMTWGIRRPAILLPAEAGTWSAER